MDLTEDAMMRRLVPLIVTLLSLACGNEPTSPSSSVELPTGPPLPTGVPNGPPVTMRGEGWDTTHLPISGAQVQVVAPSRGTVAVTDGKGNFSCRGHLRSPDRLNFRSERGARPPRSTGRSPSARPRRLFLMKPHIAVLFSRRHAGLPITGWPGCATNASDRGLGWSRGPCHNTKR